MEMSRSKMNLAKSVTAWCAETKARLMVTALLAASGSANAGFEKGAQEVGKLFTTLATAMTVIGVVAGLGCVMYSGILLFKKGGDRGDDIEWSKVAYAALGGAICLSLAYVGASSAELLGATNGSDALGKSVPIKK